MTSRYKVKDALHLLGLQPSYANCEYADDRKLARRGGWGEGLGGWCWGERERGMIREGKGARGKHLVMEARGRERGRRGKWYVITVNKDRRRKGEVKDNDR